MTANTTAAPGRLELVRAFVNTRDIDQGTDALASPGDLATWLTEQGLLGSGEAEAVNDEDREHAVAVREAFRELLLANNDGRPPEPPALATLSELAARASVSLRLEADASLRLEPLSRGVDGALARLLLIAYEAMEHGEWRRLKACRNDTCQWGFYDHSKNLSKTWCLMEVCGSQVKSRAYRARQRTRDAAGPVA